VPAIAVLEQSLGICQTGDIPLDRYPIFLRRGDIIPLNVVDDALGHGDARSAHLLTVLIHPVQEASFRLYEDMPRGATIRYRRADALTVEVSATWGKGWFSIASSNTAQAGISARSALGVTDRNEPELAMAAAGQAPGNA
jgi:alpha-glucosidase (family GH31 glycosyl hydrolase)